MPATRSNLDQLAIFSGNPAFEQPLHVGRPNLGDRKRLMERIDGVFERRWLSNNGPMVQELEAKLAAMLGVKNCIAFCNATIALEILTRAAGMTGEVIVPSFTFIATAHALQWQQTKPVFCDVGPDSHNIDPARIEELITPHTTGIIGVHVWGEPCDTEALETVAKKHNLKLAYDAAHAFGCSRQGKMIGGHGIAEVMSFHATKFFNTTEGGAILTNDDDLAKKIRLMTNFGFAGFDNVIYIGTNGKMNELSAAVGLVNLESLDEFIATNRRNYHQYRDELAGLPGLTCRAWNEEEKRNYQYIVFEVDEAKAGISRDRLIEVLWAENVLARRYFFPGCHRMEPYRSFQPHAHMLLPRTKEVCQRVLLVPNGTAVGQAEITRICEIIRLAVERGGELTRRLDAKKS